MPPTASQEHGGLHSRLGLAKDFLGLSEGELLSLSELAPKEILGLTVEADVTTAIPLDVYSGVILEALFASRTLSGLVPFVAEDISGKPGNTVQVPYINRRALPVSVSAGGTVAAVATTTGTYTVSMTKYAARDRVDKEVLEDQHILTAEGIFRNMAEGGGEKVDQILYDALIAATPAAGNTKTLAVAGTLTDIYDKIVECRAGMKKNKGIKPSHVIVHPDVEAQALKDTSEGIKHESIVVRDGQLLSIAGMVCIVTPLANANAATVGMVQATLLDARRCIAEGWKRRPTFETDRILSSDQIDLAMFFRYGVAVCDTAALGLVKNP